MPIKAKTPQKILFEAETMRQKLIAIYGTAIVLEPDWIRSSMQSLLLHVMGEMPKQEMWEEFWEKRQKQIKYWDATDKRDSQEFWRTRYDAIQSCLAVIQSTIDSIKE